MSYLSDSLPFLASEDPSNCLILLSKLRPQTYQLHEFCILCEPNAFELTNFHAAAAEQEIENLHPPIFKDNILTG